MRIPVICLMCLALTPVPSLSAGTTDTAPAGPEAQKKIVYKPPLSGAPRARIGGGSRGMARELTIVAIAPGQTGWTSREDPDLYWYVSQPIGTSPEFTLIEDGKEDPLVEAALEQNSDAGLHRISLQSLGKKLSPNVEYRWFIALVPDRASRSKDVIAGGRISYVPLASPVPDTRSSNDRAVALAATGYWYDAVSALQQTGEAGLSADLFEQEGLEAPARFIRGMK